MGSANAAGSGSAVAHRAVILYPLMLIAAIAAIVFSAVGIATMLGWIPDVLSRNESVAQSALPAAPAAAAQSRNAHNNAHDARGTAASCRECGSVESIQAIEANGQDTNASAGANTRHPIEKNVPHPVNYQVRVRMNDGTYRTFTQRAQPALAVGQKVRVTDQGVVAAG